MNAVPLKPIIAGKAWQLECVSPWWSELIVAACHMALVKRQRAHLESEVSYPSRIALGSLSQLGSMFQSSHPQPSQIVASAGNQVIKLMSLRDVGSNGVKMSLAETEVPARCLAFLNLALRGLDSPVWSSEGS